MLRNVKASKRAKVLIEYIIEHGSINTDQLARLGYKHPPRVAGDVRDSGIPLIKRTIKTKGNRRIREYIFGDLSQIRAGMDGRRVLPKRLKIALIDRDGSRCSVCGAELESRYLQIDHRVPYRIAGDAEGELRLSDYMLLCGPCNRAKSWSCEHCQNLLEMRDAAICRNCYWASPSRYKHIAMTETRRLDVVWQGSETNIYDQLKSASDAKGSMMPDFVKSALRRIIEPN